MRSLLITGASGFLGYFASRQLADRWHIHGTYHQHPVPELPIAWHSLDLRDPTSIDRCFAAAAPDAVIHAAAHARVNQCEQDPAGSAVVNIEGTHAIARHCATRSIPLLFISTDLVFDGTQAPYRETDSPSPINVYGQQKAIAEATLLNAYPEATVCRVSLLYGPPAPRSQSFLQGFIATLAAGNPLTLFTDEWRTPVLVDDAIAGLHQILTHGTTGILHLGGPEVISRYDFGLTMAAVLGLPAHNIRPRLRADVSLPAARPANVALESHRAIALGYQPRGVRAGLSAIARHPNALH